MPLNGVTELARALGVPDMLMNGFVAVTFYASGQAFDHVELSMFDTSGNQTLLFEDDDVSFASPWDGDLWSNLRCDQTYTVRRLTIRRAGPSGQKSASKWRGPCSMPWATTSTALPRAGA
jgi:hypothetical protein